MPTLLLVKWEDLIKRGVTFDNTQKFGPKAYDDLPVDLLIQVFAKRGWTCNPPFTANKIKTMTKALEDDDLVRHPYLKWKVKDLLSFIANRKIPYSSRGRMRKCQIVLILEHADAERTFPLLQLPPELRSMVYKHALAQEIETYKHSPKPAGHELLWYHDQDIRPQGALVPALVQVSDLVNRESRGLVDRMASEAGLVWNSP